MAQRNYTVNGQSASQEQFEQHWNAVLANDPVLTQIAAQWQRLPKQKAFGPEYKAFELATNKRLAELGFRGATSDHDMHTTWKDDGNGRMVLKANRGSFLDRNSDWIAAIGASAAVLGPFAAAWLAGSGAASAAGGVGAGSGAGASSGAVAGGSGAASTGAGVTGTTAGWVSKVFDNPLVEAGINTGIGFLERRARSKAEREAIDRALAEQRKGTQQAQSELDRQGRLRGEIYNQQRKDFQGLANKPFQVLGGYLGIDIPDIGPVHFQNQTPDRSQVPSGGVAGGGGPFAPGTGGQAPGSGLGAPGTTAPPVRKNLTLNDFGAPASITSGMVQMQAPDGETQWIPADQEDHYKGLGARRVS